MEPALSGCDDRVRIGPPDEGLRCLIVLGDEAVDGHLQVDDGAEDAALQASFGELGEEAFDGVEPGGRGRGEVEHPARMALQPSAHPRVLVNRIVVQDGVDDLAGRHRRLDDVEEADELLTEMALHVAADHGACEYVEGGEQRRRAVALVVVGAGSRAAGVHRQAGWVRSSA